MELSELQTFAAVARTGGITRAAESGVEHDRSTLEGLHARWVAIKSAPPEPDGSFTLSSPRGAFGDDGAYVVVDSPKGTYAKRLAIHETFHVYVDREGVLRTDHELRLWSVTVVRFHYKLTKQGERGRDSAGAAKPQRADCTDRNGLASSGVEGAQG